MFANNIKGGPGSHLNFYLFCLMCFIAIILLSGIKVYAADISADFNHDETSFPLDFSHARVSCDACHAQGIFLGTPTRCYSCHSRAGRIQASAPPATHIRVTEDCEFCHQPSNWTTIIRVDHFAVIGTCQSCHNGLNSTGKHPAHIQSSENCDDCHGTMSWLDAVFDHSNISGTCTSCHDGVTAEAKNPTHIQSTNNCEDCHRTTGWSPVTKVDHDSVIGSCFNCHNGVTAEGKHPQHLISNNDCEECHSTINWQTVTFNHNQITSACVNCHNGVTAEGKSDLHIATSNECELCHVTQGWLPATFDHSSAIGSCSGCHDGVTATGKSATHFTTTLECNECHSTINWVTVQYAHLSMNYPGDHRVDPGCISCHAASNQVVSWSSPTFQPECAACHEGNYVSLPHTKHLNPVTSYSASELRDCTGSCHIYTDSTLTVVSETRNTQHRVSDIQF